MGAKHSAKGTFPPAMWPGRMINRTTVTRPSTATQANQTWRSIVIFRVPLLQIQPVGLFLETPCNVNLLYFSTSELDMSLI